MSESEIRNPVTAIAESDATGEVAEIFADIRETMEIPLITSIWRILVDIEGGLRASWDAAKLLYKTGQPQAALLRIREEAVLPMPKPITVSQLTSVGVTRDDLSVIRSILAAYNRSNGLNLIALTALSVSPAGQPPNDHPPPRPPSWPPFPSLPGQALIPAETWSLLHRIHNLSAVSKEPGDLATVWRHLALWPGLLELIYAGMEPLARDGSIRHSMQQMQNLAQREGACIAHLNTVTDSKPKEARYLIASYAKEVHHIVTMGHGVARWLQAVN
jgi:hypothetical protein